MQQESHNTPENPQEHDLHELVRDAEEEGRKDYERTQKLFENPMGIEPPTLLTEDEEREPLREEIDAERFHLAFKDTWEYVEGNKEELALKGAEYAINDFKQGDNADAAWGIRTLSALTELGLLNTLPEEKQKELLTLAKKHAPDAAEYALNDFNQGGNWCAADGLWNFSALTEQGLLNTLPEEKQKELLTFAKKRAPDAADDAINELKQGDNWRAVEGLRTFSAEEVIYKYLSEHAKKARGAEEAREAQTLERKKKLPPIPPTREF
jgi:hypothetical protein